MLFDVNDLRELTECGLFVALSETLLSEELRPRCKRGSRSGTVSTMCSLLSVLSSGDESGDDVHMFPVLARAVL